MLTGAYRQHEEAASCQFYVTEISKKLWFPGSTPQSKKIFKWSNWARKLAGGLSLLILACYFRIFSWSYFYSCFNINIIMKKDWGLQSFFFMLLRLSKELFMIPMKDSCHTPRNIKIKFLLKIKKKHFSRPMSHQWKQNLFQRIINNWCSMLAEDRVCIPFR